MASFLGQMRDVWRQGHQGHQGDEEKATPAGGRPAVQSPGSYFSPGIIPHPRNSRIDMTDPEDDRRLELFRLMLGITSAPGLGSTDDNPRPAENIGLYTRIVKAEMNCKRNYKIFSMVINTCYILQIVIAAALTALGAANANNKAITAFGAINTVIAGFLTYLKGSGLPARLKYFGNEWKKIREYIEQHERDFAHGGCTLDVDEVVEKAFQMYHNTKRDVELNTPESFSSPTRAVGLEGAGHGVPGKIGGVDASKFESKVEDMLGKLRGLDPAKIDDVMHKLRSIDGSVRDLKGKIDSKGEEVRDTMTSLRGKIDNKGEEVRDVMTRLHDDEKDAEASIRRMGKTVSDAF